MISKFGKRTASITLIFAVCITMLFSGSGVSKVFAEEPTKPDIEVSGLKAEIYGSYAPGKVSFKVKINRKVRTGETIQLKFGYDKVDDLDQGICLNTSYSPITVKEAGKDDEIVGTLLASKDNLYLTFGKNAEKYDTMDFEIDSNFAYDLDSFSTDNNLKTISLPIYITLNGKKVTEENGVLIRTVVPAPTTASNHIGVYFLEDEDGNQTVRLELYVGKGTDNPFNKSGKIVVTLPDSLDSSPISKLFFNKTLGEILKPTGDKILSYMPATQENSLSLESIDGNKVTFYANVDKFKSSIFHYANFVFKYKGDLSYRDGEEIHADYTDVGGKSQSGKISRSEITAGGTGTILDVSKYDLTADPIIVHKGDAAPDNKTICDKVTIKDKTDGKTVTAEEIGADKTRTDSNVIDTNKPGDYSATVTVQYKDKSIKNITVPIKVIDNVIPVKPDENGKNPEKPERYVTVTMDPTANGHLAKDEASQYYVNPEKEVTIPAKDAIGNLGYKFTACDKSLKGTFKEDTTITAQYSNIDDVIPVKPGEDGKNPEKPAGYVTVTMDPTENGHLADAEASQYYVNPSKEVKIPAKDAIGNVGYKFIAWDKSLKGTFKVDTTITAQYNKLPDVIPNVPDENGNKPAKPDGYVTIKVDPGENGKLDPRDSEEYFVNPSKDVLIPLHDAIGNTGYKFSKWNPNNKGRFSKDMTIKAEYMKKKNITPLTGDMEMLLSYTVLLAASAAIVIGFRRKRNVK